MENWNVTFEGKFITITHKDGSFTTVEESEESPTSTLVLSRFFADVEQGECQSDALITGISGSLSGEKNKLTLQEMLGDEHFAKTKENIAKLVKKQIEQRNSDLAKKESKKESTTRTVSYSIDGLRKNIASELAELKEGLDLIFQDFDDHETASIKDSFNNIACLSNSFNCVSIDGIDNFSDLSDKEDVSLYD